jgi:hypothetical protein
VRVSWGADHHDWGELGTTPCHRPRGCEGADSGLEQAYAADIKIRETDEKLAPEAIEVRVEEFSKDRIVYEWNGFVVTTFEVSHGDAIKPASAGVTKDSGGSAHRHSSREPGIVFTRAHFADHRGRKIFTWSLLELNALV